MKKHVKFSVAFIVALAFVSCGEKSASGLFGNIPSAISNYETERQQLESKINADNVSKIQDEIDDLRANTITKVEEEAQSLSGKEIQIVTDTNVLQADMPVTLVFRSMNRYMPIFGFEGKIVAAKDLTLKTDPADLQGETLLSGAKITVDVKMPVAIELLDRDGKVIYSRNDIGTLHAENLGATAVVKAGTPIDFNKDVIVVGTEMTETESCRLICNLSKEPYYSRSFN